MTDSTGESAAQRDSEIESTSEASSSAARLFDIRRVIGGLFTVYGLLVLGAGLFDGSNAKEKASGVHINVWTGIGMLVLGLFMLGWMLLSPAAVPEEHEGAGDDGAADERA